MPPFDANDPKQEARKVWLEGRKQAVKERITVYDVLRLNGIELSQLADDREEQIQCPFHGKDNKPSARIYPPTDENPSGGCWCFVCQERWDVISLWRKFQGSDQPFGQTIREMEQHLGIKPAEGPVLGQTRSDQPPKNVALDTWLDRWALANDRLVWSRDSYREAPDGLKTYLLHGQVLDKIRWSVEQKRMTVPEASTILERVLNLIREVTLACQKPPSG